VPVGELLEHGFEAVLKGDPHSAPARGARLSASYGGGLASSMHMPDRMSIVSPDFPSPIDLPYSWREREVPIELYTGELEVIDTAGRLARGEGAVSLDWRPQPTIRFAISDQRVEREIEDRPRLRIPELALSAEVNLTSWSVTGGEIVGAINRAPFPDTTAIYELRFLVANLPFVLGSERLWEERPMPGGRTSRCAWAGRLVLEGAPWQLTLDRRSEKEIGPRLRDMGGHEVTHTAALRRQDERPFSNAEARDALFACGHFFGLAAGRWAAPLLAIGLDEGGAIVWRDWNPPTTSPWSGALRPFDDRHPESLGEAFKSFMHAWENPLWKQPLLYGVQMYVEANGPVYAETALVLAQAALELVSWVRFVEELRQFTAQEFDRVEKRASGRLRELLEWLNVDSAIPDALEGLAKEASHHGWADGPHAIDAMRNALIHPSKRARIEETDLTARIELHDLAMWYVELALLRVIGYDGAYLNRLGIRQAGAVEMVPWF
jgi:hypothetical protein